ncbi:hypothetical protein GQ42DRAFT_159361 [Ramicandelaber brevisporus]|nr:hypothetical protein GQ42DRAFT_159361 [Ramicandelaber brevisporus]
MFGEVPQPIVSIPASAPSSADSNRDPTRAINVNASEADLLAFASAGDSAVAQAKGKPGRPSRTNKAAATASATSVTSASTSTTIVQSQSQSQTQLQPQQSPQSLVVPREPPKPIEYTGTPPTVTLFRIGDRDNTGHPIFAAFIQRFKTISHLETAGRLKVLAVTHHMGAKTTVNLLPHADQFASKDSQAGKRKKSVGANRPASFRNNVRKGAVKALTATGLASGAHWFTIVKLHSDEGEAFYNLDSQLLEPERIGNNEDVTTFLSSLKQYSDSLNVFAIVSMAAKQLNLYADHYF